MLDLFCYSVAVFVGFLLFWFYDESSDNAKRASIANKINLKEPRSSGLLSALGFSNSEFLHVSAIEDRFSSIKSVTEACCKAGLENVRLIIAVDFSASNEWQGRRTFNGDCLHKLNPNSLSGLTFLNSNSNATANTSASTVNYPASSSSQFPSQPSISAANFSAQIPNGILTACNPYQRVLLSLAQIWEPFLDPRDGIYAFGFGDFNTKSTDVFPFHPDGRPCDSFQDVFLAYNDLARTVNLKGPTNLKPIIDKSISLCRQDPTNATSPAVYTVLVIVSDGFINLKPESQEAIVKASEYPMSIVFIGVGDGPWDTLEDYDNHIPGRKFDNFQFVDYHRATNKVKYPEVNLGLQVLMEIPDQYQMVRQLDYIK